MAEENKVDIDLSKVANLEALKRTDSEFAQTVSEAKRKNKKSKFNFAESELIQLPSKGLLYKNVTEDKDVLNGYIRIYPMTVEEEEILTTQKFLKTGSATRMVLQSCIASDIDARDILMFDSNYLLFRLRQISYGNTYKFKIKCQNQFCEKDFEHSLNISDLQFNELSDDIKEPVVVKLPKSQYTVTFIYPRLAHSEEIFMRNNSRNKTTDDRDKSKLDDLITTTIEILDKNGKLVNPKDWEDFYEALIGMDRAALTEKSRLLTGVESIKDVSCPYCGSKYEGGIPIGIEFFRL